MYLKSVEGARTATLPDGSVITRADLPPSGTVRWVASRKSAVVRGVLSGLVTSEWALRTYELSEEELAAWISMHQSHGDAALRATAAKTYRHQKER